jgi:enolase
VAPIELLMASIASAGYRPGADVALCLDPAASEFVLDGSYVLAGRGAHPVLRRDGGILVDARWQLPGAVPRGRDGRERLGRLAEAHRAHPHDIQLVGDDIFVTNPAILREGIEQGVANSILIKLNQIGTVTETLDTIKIARNAGHRAVVSHRSRETEDTLIADFAVATGVGQIKTGAPARSERGSKYNQLMRIEDELGTAGRFAGGIVGPGL